jgi:hypothetical protein
MKRRSRDVDAALVAPKRQDRVEAAGDRFIPSA